MDEHWFNLLQQVVRKRRLAVFQFDEEEWDRLRESYRGLSEFTIARFHGALDKLRTPTACLILCRDDFNAEARVGLVSSRSPVSTLESRVKVTRSKKIQPSSRPICSASSQRSRMRVRYDVSSHLTSRLSCCRPS